MTNQSQNLEGKTLSGRYLLEAPVGGGGMGDVYPAFDTQLQRKVAIKVFRFGTSKNWKREIRAIVSLDHRSIVKIYDADTDDNYNYIAMQWLPGGSLDVKKRRTLPEIAEIIKELADALQFAHSKGIIHRDVKHGNVMIGEQGQPVLIDFSIATGEGIDATRTNIGASIGTYTHMSPEQCQGELLTPATDQYSLGIIAYNLVTSELPFNPPAPTPMAYMYMHITAQPPVPWNVPEGVSNVLLRALAKAPTDRFPSILDFALALEKSIIEPNSRASTSANPSAPQPNIATYTGLAVSNSVPNPDATLAIDPVIRVPSASAAAAGAKDDYAGATLPPGTPLPMPPLVSPVTQPPITTLPPDNAAGNAVPVAQEGSRRLNPMLLLGGLVVVALIALLSGVGIALLLRPQEPTTTLVVAAATSNAVQVVTQSATSTQAPTLEPTSTTPVPSTVAPASPALNLLATGASTDVVFTASAAAILEQSAFETATIAAVNASASAVALNETLSISPTPSASETVTASPTFTPTALPSATATLEASATAMPSAIQRPTNTESPTDDLAATINAMVAATGTAFRVMAAGTSTAQVHSTEIVLSAQARLTLTQLAKPTNTPQPTVTPTHTATFTPKPTNTSTIVPTATPTISPMPTNTTIPTATRIMPGGGLGKLIFQSERSGNTQVYQINADGSDPRNLTRKTGYDGSPSYNKEGTKIAFQSDRTSNIEIFVMNADGADQKNITNDKADDLFPVWFPDGSKIIFTSNRSGKMQIYVMDADGGNPRNISNSKSDDLALSISPDGTKILFQTTRDKHYEIYVMNTDGSNQQRLTRGTANNYGSVWSPDGKKIAFETERDGNAEIYVMNANGTGQINLTKNKGGDFGPAWSPDGSQIAFDSNRDGVLQVYVMNVDGTQQHNISMSKVNEGRFGISWR